MPLRLVLLGSEAFTSEAGRSDSDSIVRYHLEICVNTKTILSATGV